MVQTDLRDIETVKDLDKVEDLAEELPRRVGSPLSYKSLAEDLEVDFKTAKRWVGILGSLYYCFQIPPYGSPKIRAVKKEQKLYLWDWSQIEDDSIRFENMVASHLLKHCHFIEDTQGIKTELRYIRDTDKREVDFVILQKHKPVYAVECKLSDTGLSKHIHYFRERTPIPHFYQVHLDKKATTITDTITTLPFSQFCKRLKLT